MKTHFITFLLLVGMSLGISSRLHAQSSYQPGEENLKAREEFQDNKFGIFLPAKYGLLQEAASA